MKTTITAKIWTGLQTCSQVQSCNCDKEIAFCHHSCCSKLTRISLTPVQNGSVLRVEQEQAGH